MNFDLDENLTSFAVSAYAEGWVRIGEQRIEEPCVVHSAGILVEVLPPALANLEVSHLEVITRLKPEIVLLGTGAKQIFADYALTEALAKQNIALETMDTGAACRSFNILLSEARSVVAALYML